MFSTACMVPSSNSTAGPVTPRLFVMSSVMKQVSLWSSNTAYTLTRRSGSSLWWINTGRIMEVVVSLQLTQLFVAFTVSFALSSFFCSGKRRCKTVACGFLHNSHRVLRLHCLAVWRGPRQEKHNPLDMQRSCLSLTVFSRKFLHVTRLCLPLHNGQKLASSGSSREDSSLRLKWVVPRPLFLSFLSEFHFALSAEWFLSLSSSFLVEVRASCENTG